MVKVPVEFDGLHPESLRVVAEVGQTLEALNRPRRTGLGRVNPEELPERVPLRIRPLEVKDEHVHGHHLRGRTCYSARPPQPCRERYRLVSAGVAWGSRSA